MLTDKDPHWWGPNPLVQAWVHDKIAPNDRVLEVGPGHAPLLRANVCIDLTGAKLIYPENDTVAREFYEADLSSDPLPFADKSFDFIYCRHTLEDMWNPFNVLKEMERVGKAGYIETPSPFAELARGQDTQHLNYRGYHHHRWMCWMQNGALNLISKFSILESVDIDDQAIDNMLRLGPYYWNTHYYWEGSINWRHLQCPQDFDIVKDYPRIINDAVHHSKIECSELFGKIFESVAKTERLACTT